MADKSNIEWTDTTWNPVTGCDKISPGCKHCYAERLAKRLRNMGSDKYRNGFDVTLHPRTLEDPLRWTKPRRVFVNSMSDLFHPVVPDSFIESVFRVMARAERHTFQLLTKRPERAAVMADDLEWTDNLWMGTSVETMVYAGRIDSLRRIPAAIRFVSAEPLLGSLHGMDLRGVAWVIVGGESGPGARPMRPQWAREIRDMCVSADIPFFFKQWGGVNRKLTGRLLDGREWNEEPQRGDREYERRAVRRPVPGNIPDSGPLRDL